ncbi:MAG: hypothetical protein JW934_21785 [Anaerolineae bacterium]|nr:hypothetical protein [Anaerolineae bacterium]
MDCSSFAHSIHTITPCLLALTTASGLDVALILGGEIHRIRIRSTLRRTVRSEMCSQTGSVATGGVSVSSDDVAGGQHLQTQANIAGNNQVKSGDYKDEDT